jgi:hypothetical protein
MAATYIYLPDSVEGINSLEFALKVSDPSRSIQFRGLRLMEAPLQPADGTDYRIPKGRTTENVLVVLRSELSTDELADLIDDHAHSAQQGFLIPMCELKTEEVGGIVRPVGTSDFVLPGDPEEGKTYFSLSANMNIARRHCRMMLFPEINYATEEALERLKDLRLELEKYMLYAVKTFPEDVNSYFSADRPEALSKIVRMVEVVAEEQFPKFRHAMYSKGFSEDFLKAFSAELAGEPVTEDGYFHQSQINEIFVLACLTRDIVSTQPLLDHFPDRVPEHVKHILKAF